MNYLVTNIWKYWKFGNNWKFGNSGGSWIGGFFLKNTTTSGKKRSKIPNNHLHKLDKNMGFPGG